MAGCADAPQAVTERPAVADDAPCRGAYADAMLRTAALILAAALVAVTYLGQAEAQLRCRAMDGDTLACGAERVRVMGLDAPEMRGRCPAEARKARTARDRMAALVIGGVSLQPHGRDRYRRLLAVVRDWQGRDVGAVLIREGLARPYRGERRRSWCG